MADNVIDNLSIEIKSTSQNAEASIDKLVASLDSLVSSLESVGKSTNNIGKVSNATKKIKSGFNSTTGSVGNFTKSLSRLYFNAKALTSAFKGLGGSLTSAMDYMETSNYWNVSVNKAMSQITDRFGEFGAESAAEYGKYLLAGLEDINKKLTGYTIGESGEALSTGKIGLGVSIEKLMAFQARVAGIASSVGLLGETSVETTKFLSMLASDLSSLTNTDISTVYNNLISTLIGQSRAGYRYGFDVTNNTLQQLATELGIEKAVSEMEQAEKMQLRVIALLRQSEIAWTDMAVTVDSAANQYRIFGEQTENLSRTFGNLFLPIVQNALPWINGATIALNNLLTTLGYQMFGDTWLEDLQNGISDGATNDLTDLEGVLEDTTDASEKLQKSLRGFDELKTISSGSNSVINALVGGSTGLDLTDIISAELGEYTGVWNEAFANIESESEKIAERLTEDFGEVAETFERLEPAIVGVGTAFVTYEIAGKIGKLVTALGKLSGPAAGIIVGAGLLAGLGTAIHDLYSELKIADLETRFGDITLSAKELEEVAKYIVDNKNLEEISKLLSAIGEASDIKAKIQNSVDEINKLNWKVSIGMQLTEEEEEQYKTAIDTYVKNANDYVEQMQYSTNVGIKLFLSDSETGEEITSTVNAFYESVRGKMQELGERLNQTTTAAWNDGLLTIDEAKAISEIQSQMAEIEKTLATTEYTARMQMLEMQFDGADLDAETYKKLVEERDKLIKEYSDSLDESLVYTLAQVNLAYQTTYGEASTEEAKRKIKEEWDNAKKELMQGKDMQVGQMYLNALGFDLNTLAGTFGEELDTVLPQIMKKISDAAADISFLSSTATNESALTGYLNELKKDINKILKDLPRETRENLKDLIEVMQPTDEIEKIAQSYYETTGEVPQAIADALSAKYVLDAIGGGKEEMLKAMLVDANTIEVQQVYKSMETLGIDSLNSFMKGVDLTAPLATTSVTDFFSSINEKVLTESTALNELFKKAGEGAASSFSEGFWDSKELFPSSGNTVPIDISKFNPTWKSNLPKIDTLSFPRAPLSDSALKDFQAAMREKVEVDVKIKTEPFESELVRFVVDEINMHSRASQSNWIEVYAD